MGWNRGKKGFTLIELLVVVIIVAVLAAVGIPLLSGNVLRARTSEAEAALGTIRTALRSEFAESASYIAANGLTPVNAQIGLTATDLSGRFFGANDYAAITAGVSTFCSGVTGSGVDGAPPGGAVRGSQVGTVARSINQDGTFFATNNCSGTPLN